MDRINENELTIVFTPQNLADFAAKSGDFNPLHLDADYARKTVHAQPVVYGALAVLFTLDRVFVKETKQLLSLRVRFSQSLVCGVNYRISVNSLSQNGVELSLDDGEIECMWLTCEFTGANPTEHVEVGIQADEKTTRRQHARALTQQQIQEGLSVFGRYGVVEQERGGDNSTISPGSTLAVESRDCIMLCSYLAGMEIPGREALLSEVSLQFFRVRTPEGTPFDYCAQTGHFDAAYGLSTVNVEIASDGAPVAEGKFKAFVRKTIKPESARRIFSSIPPDSQNCFSGKVVLVTGASRGLGAAMAQVFALQGARVILNFHRSVEQAQALKAELVTMGCQVFLMQGDIGDVTWCAKARDRIAEDHGRLDVLVCNAGSAPQALDPNSSQGSSRFRDFFEMNLRLTSTPLATFGVLLNQSRGVVLAISTSFVTQPPKWLAHYVATKCAIEGLVRGLSATHPSISFVIARPPPLVTDMNNGPLGSAGAISPSTVALTLGSSVRKADRRVVDVVETFQATEPGRPVGPKCSEVLELAQSDTPGPNNASHSTDFVIASTFTAEPLKPALAFWQEKLSIGDDIHFAPFGQVFQQLLDPTSRLQGNSQGFNIVLVRLEDWLRDHSFDDEQAAHDYLQGAMEDLLRCLRSYCLGATSPTLLMVCPSTAGKALDNGTVLSLTNLDQQLVEQAKSVVGLFTIHAAVYHEPYRVTEIFDADRDEIAQIPYCVSYYRFVATLIARWAGHFGRAQPKVIVVDCDETLWHGVCAEHGTTGVRIEGSALKLQQFLVKQRDMGVLLCLCSKNEPHDVEAVFNAHTMPLCRDDFVAARVNWLGKPENLISIAEELSLGIESFVFIDDNPIECAQMNSHCPQVLTIEWPSEAKSVDRILDHYWALDQYPATLESSNRTTLYQAQQARERAKSDFQDFPSFIASLQLEVRFARLTTADTPRAAELAARTNQFNSSSRRYSVQKLQHMVESARQTCMCVNAKDRFGDYGLVGAMVLEVGEHVLGVEAILLSCRVLGRGVEYRMMAKLGAMAVEAGVSEVHVAFEETSRNAPIRNFLCELAQRSNTDTKEPFVFGSTELANVQFVPNVSAPEAPISKNENVSARRLEKIEVIDEVAKLSACDAALDAAIQAAENPSSASDGVPPDTGIHRPAGNKSTFQELLDIIERVRGPSDVTLSRNTDLEFLLADSFGVVDLTVELRKDFGDLPATVLFEHPTLGRLSDYLASYVEPAISAPAADVDDLPAKRPSSANVDHPRLGKQPTKQGRRDDIAIIGMNGIFPGAKDIIELWDLLKDGRDAIVEVPANRWSSQDLFDPTGRAGTSHSKWGGFIENADFFDPGFFNITPAQVELLDPQQRLFLQVVWGLLEDAGQTRERLGSNTGVFVGVISNDYGVLAAEASLRGVDAFRGADYYQIANRISYFLDLHGPSMAVDTACSASATAVHLACNSLRSGDCEAAIVGGVNLILHPSRYVNYSRMGIMSKTPECKPFGEGADGTVFGEGVAALLLKPLNQAIADGDRIDGVIRSTAINSGGKTNGFTVPNPDAQCRLVDQALRKADVDPRSIGYIEAHGTGTALGDPIEIRGLTTAFRGDREERQDHHPRCAIGSIKGNIGHLESCAAIGGIIKVLLQMRHCMLVPSLHSSNTNSLIDFERSPFTVQQTLETWSGQPLDADDPKSGRYPLRAGVSAFGAGGSNAHIIIEQYQQTQERQKRRGGTALFVLSAKDLPSLQAYAGRMAKWMADHFSSDKGGSVSLDAIAWTLQVGREAMSHRLAVFAKTPDELADKWRKFHEGGARNEPGLIFPGDQPSASDLHEMDIDVQTLEAARNWVNNAGELCALDNEYIPVPLPTYQFAGDRYWLPHGGSQESEGPLHPMVDRLLGEDSFGVGIVFEKQLSLSDPFIGDHRVLGQCVCPAAGHMAIVHGVIQTLHGCGNYAITKIRWLRPLQVNDGTTCVRIELKGDKESANFAIFDRSSDGGAICEGAFERSTRVPTTESRISLVAARQRCSIELEREQVYDNFCDLGIEYGPYYRSLRKVRRCGNEALGYLRLPDALRNHALPNVLNASLLDGALQAAMLICEEDEVPMVPFSMEEVVFLRPIPARVVVHVRRTAGNVFNLAIVDEEGRACLRIQALAFRALQDPLRRFFYVPDWSPTRQSVDRSASRHRTADKPALVVAPRDSGGLAEALVATLGARCNVISLGERDRQLTANHNEVNCEDPVALARLCRDIPEIGDVYFLGGFQLECENIADTKLAQFTQEQGVLSLFRLVKGLIKREDRLAHRSLRVALNGVFQVGRGDSVLPFASALVGLTQVIAKEHPAWETVGIDLGLKVNELDARGVLRPSVLSAAVGCLNARERHAENTLIAIRSGQAYARKLTPVILPRQQARALRQQGVYIVVGGAGGLGKVICREFAQQVKARIVILGRRLIDQSIKEQLTEIESLGGQGLYIAVDISDRDALDSAVDKARRHFGAVHGVVHSAIVLRDRTIANMNEDDFLAALAPKSMGMVNLYRAVQSLPLDFMMFFSSINSFTANAGQCNYVAGCTFKDAYALAINQSAKFPVKLINWGYWGSVGIVASDFYRTRLAAEGIHAIEPEEGVEAVQRILAQSETQVLAVKMDPAPLRRMGVETVERCSEDPPKVPSAASLNLDPSGLAEYYEKFEQVQKWGRDILASTFQKMGAFKDNEKVYRLDDIASAIELAPPFERLLPALLEILTRAKYLESRAGGWVASADWIGIKAVRPTLDRRGERIRTDWPELSATANLLEDCVNAYPSVLPGHTSPMSVLFPGGAKDSVASVYQGNERVDFHNRAAALVMKHALRQILDQTTNAQVKILEIGAGTGASTHFMLDALGSDITNRIHYTYTDVSVGFCAHGTERFGARFPFMSFEKLDIAKAPEQQGFELHQYDVVLATNVLHATINIAQTLNNVKKLLCRGGILLLNEDCKTYDFATMTFGLTDGWWQFADKERRLPFGPLISTSKWRSALTENGFVGTELYGQPDVAEEQLMQVVIATSSDGRIPDQPSIRSNVVVDTDVGMDSLSIMSDEDSRADSRSISEHANDRQDIGEQASIDYVKGVFSAVLKYASNSIDESVTFETLGIDSLVSMEIVNRLERDFGSLPSTLLFEYMTIKTLASYFRTEHCDALRAVMQDQAPSHIEPDALFTSGPVESETPSSTEQQDIRSESTFEPTRENEPGIAIIGLSGRYPGAADVESFWQNLREGRSSIVEIPQSRWDWREYFDPRRGVATKSYSKWGGFIENVDMFDPLFFSISPREAAGMDPQERLFLQTAWGAFEDAGYPPRKLASTGPVGVFVGVMNSDYSWLGAEAHQRGDEQVSHASLWSCANRVSWYFDLKGPSMAIDTACSSSLTAVHMACDSLRGGACTLAVAGGVNVIVHPGHYVRLCALNMLADDQYCRTFGEGANGFVPGEGVGAVVLKPLAKARADGDMIYGVIRASATNAGGRTGGYTVPNPNAQADLIGQVLREADVDPSTIGYVEAHGTGTSLGDPIEVAGLARAYDGGHSVNKRVANRNRCALGSVKPNIGHLESAAGIAGLTKVLLQFKHGQLAPTLNASPPNPKIEFDNGPFVVNHRLRDWSTGRDGTTATSPRRAAISSFGAGGTNVHMLLEAFEVKEQLPKEKPGQQQLFVLSAHTDSQLEQYVEQTLNHLQRFERSGTQQSDQLQTVVATEVALMLDVDETEIDPTVPLWDLGMDATQYSVLATKIGDLTAGQVAHSFTETLTLNDLTQAVLEVTSESKNLEMPKPNELPTPRLVDIVYTLQTGREPMDHRLAVCASSIDQLSNALAQFLAGQTSNAVQHGQVQRAAAAVSSKLVCRAIKNRDYKAIGRLWVSGAEVDWGLLHSSAAVSGLSPRRISLPTYPFALERCWLSSGNNGRVNQSVRSPTMASDLPTKSKMLRVAVIGAGPAGLATAKCLGEDGHQPTVFEKTGRVGGIWCLDHNRSGGAYRSTRLQTSKYTSLFSDYPPPESMSLFPNSNELCDYLNGYADHFRLNESIQFNTELVNLEKIDSGWRLRLKQGEEQSEQDFDAVAICSGAFWQPVIPGFAGIGEFAGRTLHSSDYKDPAIFNGKRVLVIGNGVSGMDVASDAAPVAESVTWSLRSPKMIIPRMFGFTPNDCSITPVTRMLARSSDINEILAQWRMSVPEHLESMERSGLMPTFPLQDPQLFVNDSIPHLVASGKIKVKPQPVTFGSNSCLFADGSEGTFDVVVFCTGYREPAFSFAPDIHVDALYKRQFHPEHSRLCFMGLKPASLSVIPTIELEARWFSKVLAGVCTLPGSDEMKVTIERDARRMSQPDGIFPAADSSRDDIEMASKIGAFPDPSENWELYWRLINLPRIPAIYRLVGANRWHGAEDYLEQLKKKIYLNHTDARIQDVKCQMLARLSIENLRQLCRSGQITENEFEQAVRSGHEGDLPSSFIGSSQTTQAYSQYRHVLRDLKAKRVDKKQAISRLRKAGLSASGTA